MEIKFQNNRLKSLRVERGLSLRTLSQRTGVDFTSINYCEKGQRNFSANTIKILSDFFGVSVDYLLGVSPADMYDNMVSSLQDFYKDYLCSDGSVVRSLSEEVQKPLRSKLELIFLIDSLKYQNTLDDILKDARLRAAKEDFEE